MAYCTVAQAQSAGAVGDPTLVVQPAIDEAADVINAYTDDRFEPQAGLTVYTKFDQDGIAPLPLRVQSVTGVSFVGFATPIDPGAYRVRSGNDPGDVDAIEVLKIGYDDLVVGAESWSGGFMNLTRLGYRLAVTGTFGYATVPRTIARVAAIVAARITQTGLGDDLSGVKSLAVEGYRVEFDVNAQAVGTRTTGWIDVDRMLWPFRRTPSAAN